MGRGMGRGGVVVVVQGAHGKFWWVCTSWNPHSVSDQNIILCAHILSQTWPKNRQTISDLDHKLPCFRPEAQNCYPINFRPGPQIYTLFQAWTRDWHPVSAQARVVRKVVNTIHGLNHYPVDSVACFVNTYPLDKYWWIELPTFRVT